VSVEYKDNAESLAQRVMAFDAQLIEAMQLGLRKGVRLFEGKMIKGQFSGRRGDNKGLNRRSGAAAGSWYLRESGKGSEYSVTLANGPQAWYIAVHQHHQFNGVIRAKNKPYLKFQIPGVGWRQAKEVYIPKRLFILEDFAKDGTADMIRKSILREAVKAAKRGGAPLKATR
jgi:hypothetical protein